MDNSFEWLESRGLCTEAAYPYTAGTGIGGQCQQACTPVVSVAKFTDVPKGDEAALKSAVAQQPTCTHTPSGRWPPRCCSRSRRAAPAPSTMAKARRMSCDDGWVHGAAAASCVV